MIKPTSSYKMPKSLKMRLANILDPHHRGAIKRSYIQAHLENQEIEKRSKHPKSKNKQDQEE